MIEYLTQPFFKYLPTPLAAIAAAIVWGQKQYLSANQYQAWQVTGLLHLLVLSGQNIMLLVSFGNLLSERLGLKFRLMLTTAIASFYLLAFGGDPPIVRAAIMALLSVLAINWQKTTQSVLLLFISCLIMLILRPDWLGSLSFQLSVAATFGIQVLYPYFLSRYKTRNPLIQAFMIALSAQLATTPLLLINFRRLSLISLPLNVLASFLVEPIMIIGVATSLFGNFVPGITELGSLLLLGLVGILNWIINILLPLASWLTLHI